MYGLIPDGEYRFDLGAIDGAVETLQADGRYALKVHWPRVLAASPDKLASLKDAAEEAFQLLPRATAVDLVCLWASNHNLGEDRALALVQDLDGYRGMPKPSLDKRGHSQSWRERRTTAAELQKMAFPPMHYILPGLVPEGVTLLVARPKIGKSWLALDVAVAAAAGRFTLGTLQPATGDCLYLALEDSKRRLQRRMSKLLPAPDSRWPDRLELHTEWHRADQGGLDDLAEWCRTTKEPRLIVVDTLEKFRPAEGGKNNKRQFGVDYQAIGGLQRLATDRPGLAIIIIHHDKKGETEDAFDSISGTLGLNASADTLLVIKKNAGGATLHCTGRDIEGSEKAIQFDKPSCRWTILGEVQEVRRSNERVRIIEAIRLAGEPLSVSKLQAAANHSNRSATDMLLGRMCEDGDVIRVDRGLYGLPSDEP